MKKAKLALIKAYGGLWAIVVCSRRRCKMYQRGEQLNTRNESGWNCQAESVDSPVSIVYADGESEEISFDIENPMIFFMRRRGDYFPSWLLARQVKTARRQGAYMVVAPSRFERTGRKFIETEATIYGPGSGLAVHFFVSDHADGLCDDGGKRVFRSG